MAHTFKEVNIQEGITVYEWLVQEEYERLKAKTLGIKKLKELGAPNTVIQQQKELCNKIQTKLKNNKHNPQFTYRDGLDKNTVFNIIIQTMKDEYNRNNRLVATIINDSIRINYITRYCPIINKI